MDKSISQLSFQLENISFENLSTANVSVNKSIRQAAKTPIKSSSNNPGLLKTPNRHNNRNKENNNIHKKTPKTPANGDRFIPDRSAMNFDVSHYVLNNSDASCTDNNGKPNTITELVGDLANYRIISYQKKAPESHTNGSKVVYSSTKSSVKKNYRHIPTQPESILDAPDIRNDYYLQLIDWNNQNVLAVALQNEVYLWNAKTGSITNLVSIESPDYISSLSWTKSGSNHLAVGLSTGVTQIWDVKKNQRLRSMQVSEMRISCMCWNSYILSNGSKDGIIYNHDVRIPASLVGRFQRHEQEVCGLKWSPNGKFLASGSNDNTVNIWPNAFMGETQSFDPLFTLTAHQAAVKAIAWCPWRTNCLATGGGSADRTIRIWNTQNAQCMYSVDTRSQVSAILWSEEYRELISSHGYANNELIIWQYPSLNKVTELTGHSSRILSMAMSADGSTVVSLGADETLRFWGCFQLENKKTVKKTKDIKIGEHHALKFSIR